MERADFPEYHYKLPAGFWQLETDGEKPFFHQKASFPWKKAFALSGNLFSPHKTYIFERIWHKLSGRVGGW